MLYISTPAFGLNSVWILNNLSVGIYFGITVCFTILYIKEKNQYFLGFSFISFLLYCILRIEGVLFGVLFLVVLANSVNDKKLKLMYVGCIASVSVVMYCMYFLYMGLNKDSIFWNPIKGGTMQIIICAYFLFLVISESTQFKESRFNKGLKENIARIMIGMIFFAICIMCILKYDLAANNFKILIESGLKRGYWGYIWPILLYFSGISNMIFEDYDEVFEMLKNIVSSFFMLLFLLMLFNKVYLHAGYGDSAHRMMLHILPVSSIYLSICLAKLVRKEESNE